MEVEILDADEVCICDELQLLADAPEPCSSDEPYDILAEQLEDGEETDHDDNYDCAEDEDPGDDGDGNDEDPDDGDDG